MDFKMLDELARRVAQSLPAGANELKDDLEKTVRTSLRGGLSRLDLVTREQFDIQSEVLARTRAKVDALEQQVAALEAKLLDLATPKAKAKAKD